jgi:hypothetical protein
VIEGFAKDEPSLNPQCAGVSTLQNIQLVQKIASPAADLPFVPRKCRASFSPLYRLPRAESTFLKKISLDLLIYVLHGVAAEPSPPLLKW